MLDKKIKELINDLLDLRVMLSIGNTFTKVGADAPLYPLNKRII